MKLKHPFIIFIAFMFLSFRCFALEQNEDFPILAYYGVSPEYATDGHFKAFADCGFNISHFAFSSAEQYLRVAKVAEKHNIKLMFQCNALYTDTENTVKKVMNDKSLYAYHIYDEPSYSKLEDIDDKYVDKITKLDKKHPCYINLLPYYDDSMLRKNIMVNSYLDYIMRAAKINTPQISFDYYPIKTNEFRSTWFENLEIVRKVSIKTGKPFWGFVLSVPHVKYPMPTIAMLRLQIYANLVYGAKGIQYFTYWTLKSPNYDFHDAPVSSEGRFTKTYSIVKQMNKELKGIASLFKDGTIFKVNHLGKIPKATQPLNEMPLNIKSINVTGGNGAIVSQLKCKDKQYLIMLNKDYKSQITVNIQALSSSVVRLDKKLSPHKLASHYTLSGGDILIFRLD